MVTNTQGLNTVNVNHTYINFAFTCVYTHCVIKSCCWFRTTRSVNVKLRTAVVTEADHWVFLKSLGKSSVKHLGQKRTV